MVNNTITSLMPKHILIQDFYPIFKNIGVQTPLFVRTSLLLLAKASNFSYNFISVPFSFSILDDDNTTPEIIFEKTGFRKDLFAQFPASSKYSFIIHNSKISRILSFLLNANYLSEPLVFETVLNIIELVHEPHLQYELLENYIFSIWLWASTSQTNMHKIFRLLTNFIGHFNFRAFEHSLFSQMLVQIYILFKYSTKDFSILKISWFKNIENFPLTINDMINTILIIFREANNPSLNFDNNNDITLYLDLLTKFMFQKNFVIPTYIFYTLTDLALYSNIDIICFVIQIINNYLEKDDKYQCLMLIALKCSNVDVFNFLPQSIDIECIKYQRFDLEFHNFKGTVDSNNSLWFLFPLIFLLRSNSLNENFIIAALLSFDKEIIPEIFSRVLNMVFIFSASKCFDKNRIEHFKELFILEELNYILNRPSCLSVEGIIQIVIYSFISLYYKFTSERTHSNALLKLFGIEKEKSLKYTNMPFSIDYLQTIFRDSLFKCKLLFYVSYKSSPNEGIIHQIKLILSNPMFDNCNSIIIKKIKKFISNRDNFCPYPKVSIRLFSLLGNEANNMTSKIYNLIQEVRNYVLPKSKDINIIDHRTLNNFIHAERIRVKMIALNQDLQQSNINIPNYQKYIHFPFYILDKTKWEVQEEELKFNYTYSKKQNDVCYLPLFSLQCTLITPNNQFNSSLFIYKDEILISKLGYSEIIILLRAIKAIFIICNKYIEIFTTGCFSYLLLISTDEIKTIFQFLTILNVKIITVEKYNISNVISQWSKKKISTFNLLIALNLLNGLSFNLLSDYPFLPICYNNDFLSTFEKIECKNNINLFSKIICKNKSLTSIDNIINNFKEIDCTLPQFYYYFNNNSDLNDQEKLYRTIYELKKGIENKNMLESIIKWIKVQFNVVIDLEKNNKLSKEVSSIKITHTIKKSVFFQNAKLFCFIDKNNTLHTMSYSWILNHISTKQINYFKFNTQFEKLFLIPIKSCILIFDQDKNLGYKIINNSESISFSYLYNITSYCVVNDNFIYVIDKMMIAISNEISFPDKYEIFITEDEEIDSIIGNSNFDLIAYKTNKSNINVFSILDNDRISTISINEKIDHFCFTEEWGFIICITANNYYLFSINGVLLLKCEFSATIKQIYTFSSNGIDYIMYTNLENDIIYFDPFYPEKQTVFGNIPNVSSITYNKSRQSLIILNDSSLHSFRFPVKHKCI